MNEPAIFTFDHYHSEDSIYAKREFTTIKIRKKNAGKLKAFMQG